MSKLAENLDRIIKERGLSLRSVSLATGKSPQLVNDIISGRSKSPSLDTVTALAKVLEVPVHHLTGEKPDIKPDLEILSSCLLWLLDNLDRFKNLKNEQIVNELMKHYGRMVNDQINDKAEAVRITKYVFEALQDKRSKLSKSR
jgi:transcriptional regulator with XRE-family HTH domain